ncbi:MAG: LptF/LptG family permease, partial [Planctomycetia bacterium]
MKIIDRYLLANFLSSYFICFVSLVGLYIVIDLFANADEFLEDGTNTVLFIRRVGLYYFIHSFDYFNRLSPIITQIAAMTTLAMLHRNNEIVALLAAGIPTRRALAPILGGVLLVIGLGVANREYCLPHLAERLERIHEEIETGAVLLPTGQMDLDQTLICAKTADGPTRRLDKVLITLSHQTAGALQDVECESAFNERDPATGLLGWRLRNSSPIKLTRKTGKLYKLPNGDWFLVSSVTFDDVVRRKNWTYYASTGELVEELRKSETRNAEDLRVMVHNRILTPVMNMLLVLIGVPFVLQWERKNIYRSIEVSMVLSGLFFMT